MSRAFWPFLAASGAKCQSAGGGGEGTLNILNILEGSLEHAWCPCADLKASPLPPAPFRSLVAKKIRGPADHKLLPSWVVLGHVALSWGHLGPCWAVLGPCWGYLGSIFGHIGVILGHLGVMLAFLGLSWAILGHLGPSWGQLGHLEVPSWWIWRMSHVLGGPGGQLGQLGHLGVPSWPMKMSHAFYGFLAGF
jgi:hypothetical protein